MTIDSKVLSLSEFFRNSGAKRVALLTDKGTWSNQIDTLEHQLRHLKIVSYREPSFRYTSKNDASGKLETTTEPISDYVRERPTDEAVLYIPGCLCCITSSGFETLGREGFLEKTDPKRLGIALSGFREDKNKRLRISHYEDKAERYLADLLGGKVRPQMLDYLRSGEFLKTVSAEWLKILEKDLAVGCSPDKAVEGLGRLKDEISRVYREEVNRKIHADVGIQFVAFPYSEQQKEVSLENL